MAREPGSTSPPAMSAAPRSSVAAHPENGIPPFDSLLAEVMEQEPEGSAQRVFWIMENGSVHAA
jgi:hypothetical protein